MPTMPNKTYCSNCPFIASVAAIAVCVFLYLLTGCSHANDELKSEAQSAFDAGPADVLLRDEAVDGLSDNRAPSADAGRKTPKTKKAESATKSIVADYGSNVAVCMLPLDGTSGFSINGEERFVAASMIKLLVLACLMDQASDEVATLDKIYHLDSSDCVGGTGEINALPTGASLSYSELAKAMIAHSDNTATNVLIDSLGMDAINKEAENLGLNGTKLQRLMMDFDGKTENYICANDAATILRGFTDGTIGNEDTSALAIGFLKSQVDNDALTQGLPDGIEFAHKTGSLNGARHDGGIVYASEPYILVVLTTLESPIANQLMRDLSKTIYEAMTE